MCLCGGAAAAATASSQFSCTVDGTDHSIRTFNNDDNINRASVINVNKITREQENSSSN